MLLATAVDAMTDVGEAYWQIGSNLLAAKKLVKHGEWEAWLTDNFTIGTRQAQRYMRVAKTLTLAEAKASSGDAFDDEGGMAGYLDRVATRRERRDEPVRFDENGVVVEPEDILTAAEASRATTLAKNVEGPRYSKTGVLQPEDDSEQRAARDKRRATGQALTEAGYAALVAQQGDSAHLRVVKDQLLRLAKGLV
ncbi:MAG TPA: DUF3102 domain-containing protein [bacterium]|nr:DUF3102 domain-containing protein [bacterium]